MIEIDSNTWQTRAAMCELLALSFRYPDATLADVVASGEWMEAAEEIAHALDIDWSAADASDAAEACCKVDGESNDGESTGGGSSDDVEGVLSALRTEATRLFIGMPEPAISPYEGVWRLADEGAEALLFVNPHSMEVERFCTACGLGRPEGTNEPLDYIATELELLEYLAARAAVDALGAPADDSAEVDELEAAADIASTDNTVASANLPGGSAEAAYDQFMVYHAVLWMPKFAAKVQQESHLPFFAQAASLLEGFIAV